MAEHRPGWMPENPITVYLDILRKLDSVDSDVIVCIEEEERLFGRGAMAGAKALVEEYEKPCTHHKELRDNVWLFFGRRFDCPFCMMRLKREVGL